MLPIRCTEYKTRSGGSDQETLEEQRVYWETNGVYGGQDIQSRKRYVSTALYRGQDTPDYHRRVKKGELIPFTLWWQLTREGRSTGTYGYQTSDGKTKYLQGYGQYTPYTDWIVTAEQVQAYAPERADIIGFVQGAAAKIYGNGYDALTALAELTQLRHQFVNIAKRLVKMDFPRNWRRLTNDWLEGRYGWRVLIYDIMSLHEACAHFDETRTRYSEKCGDKYKFVSSSAVEKSWMAFYGLLKVEDTITIEKRGSVVADIVVPRFQFNPLQTAWELIPLSFVVDWFLSVGKSLAAISFLSLQTNYTASYGYRITVDRVLEFDTTSFKSGYSGSGVHQKGVCKAVFCARTPCHVPIFPQTALRLNAFKILDLIALIAQRLK